ncbi:Radical SAM domain protein, partial [hydrothermal vent metagenome]
MIANVAPSFDVLERLGQGREADLINFVPVSRSNNRGRGAQSNRSGRFEKTQREIFDDGWADDDPEEKFETIEHMERATSIITRNSSPDLHFDRSINPYRGCAHGCSYCYARPTHTYLGHSAGLDFERDIYIKPNAAALLRKELSHSRYRAKPIAIGTNTDPYQPVERKHKIMRQLLEVFCETKHPVMITTKSALIVRDLDLLTELARQNLVFVTM